MVPAGAREHGIIQARMLEKRKRGFPARVHSRMAKRRKNPGIVRVARRVVSLDFWPAGAEPHVHHPQKLS